MRTKNTKIQDFIERCLRAPNVWEFLLLAPFLLMALVLHILQAESRHLMEKLFHKYRVLAAISPGGEVEHYFSLLESFDMINRMFPHRDTRYLVLAGNYFTDIRVVDLWKTLMTSDHPYNEPAFIDERFTHVDQAVGFVLLTLC